MHMIHRCWQIVSKAETYCDANEGQNGKEKHEKKHYFFMGYMLLTRDGSTLNSVSSTASNWNRFFPGKFAHFVILWEYATHRLPGNRAGTRDESSR